MVRVCCSGMSSSGRIEGCSQGPSRHPEPHHARHLGRHFRNNLRNNWRVCRASEKQKTPALARLSVKRATGFEPATFSLEGIPGCPTWSATDPKHGSYEGSMTLSRSRPERRGGECVPSLFPARPMPWPRACFGVSAAMAGSPGAGAGPHRPGRRGALGKGSGGTDARWVDLSEVGGFKVLRRQIH
ncbi:MAG: hypothetical protein JWN65_2729 [Solirubrobacterales bacterium]|nr:hypothetical protein [Solirubrobacterales bacterium]